MAFSFLCSLLFFLSFLSPIISFKQTYIVHMNENHKPLTYATRAHWYTAHLQSLSIDASSILYSYDSVFSGFAVSLSPSDALSLRRSASVLRMYNDTLYELHTTRSPAFLGLDAGPTGGGGRARTEVAADNVIIGVLDSGIWPESPSFSDAGMAEIPARWRGTCEKGDDFQPSNCNRKLIGARSFWKGYENAVGRKPSPASARDRDGHGTHTSSTAAGSRVANASFLGYAAGLARGMAPLARLAMYKVCWSRLGCFAADILAGFDAAISDGVDVLSLSMGSSGATPIYRDAIAIGAISAVDRGIFVACSAGNSGPLSGTVANVAPWIATVGAGSIDRDFPAYVSIGNGLKYAGVSLYSGKGMGVRSVPLFYSNVSRDVEDSGNQCFPGSLDSKLARGKVVLCESGGNSRVGKGLVVEKAGGVGMIVVARGGREKEGESHLLPAVLVGQKIGDQIRSYVRSDPNPTAVISFGGTVLDVKPSPVVAGFSSRGPNELTSQILKPDLIGPGLNILAAWSELIGPTRLDEDTRVTKFNIISGTSMSCPHISGVAALLKATHPDWSPSAIKSALMTTAYTLDNTKSPLLDAGTGARSNPFAHGSGHINPTKALSPGLVYELTTSDYIDYICSLGYDDDDVRTIVRHGNVTCPRSSRDPGTLNYPSFSVLFGRRSQKPVKYERVLTNVGPAGSVYTVTVGRTSSVSVTVTPAKLVFKQMGQKLKYYVTFTSKARNLSEAFGWIAWSNKQHQVRSPVAYMWQ